MALQKQVVTFPLLQGVDEKSSQPLSQPGSVKDAQNVIFTKAGQINKRKGFGVFRNVQTVVGDRGGLLPQLSGLTTVGRRLHQFRDSLLFCDGQALYSKVGTNSMKMVEDLLDCTYANNSIFTPNNQKVGRVNLIRKTVSSVDYNVLSYVQTVPTGSSATSKYQIVVAVQEVVSGAFFREPTVIHEVNRSTGSNFYNNISSMPSLHMVEDNNSNIYLVFSQTNTSGLAAGVQFVKYSFAGSEPPSLGSPTKYSLATNAGLALTTHHRAPGIAVEVKSDKTELYVAAYTSTGTAITGKAVLHRYLFSNLPGTLTATTEIQLSSSGSGATEINTNGIGYGSGTFPAIALRFDPDDTSSHPLFAAFNQALPGGKGSSEQQVFMRFFASDLSGAAGNEFTHASLQQKYLVNGTQSYLSATSADVFLTLAHSGTDGSPATPEGGSTAFYKDTTDSYGGVASLTSTNMAATITAKEGFITGRNDAATGAYLAEFGSACKLYAAHEGGANKPIKFAIVEPGAGFVAATIPNSSTLDLKQKIETFFGFSMGSGETLTLTIDENNDLLRTKDHEVVYMRTSKTAVSSYASINQNASLISDSFRNFIKPDSSSNATALGPQTYVNISRTNGNDGNFNSCNYLIDTTGKLIASGVPTQSSLNYTSDYRSIYQNEFRLFDGISRITSVDKDVLGNKKILFGSNILTSSGNTYTDAEQNSALDTIDVDQFYSVSITEINLQTDRSLPAVDVGNQLLIGGGSLFSFDGQTLVENGFYENPEIRSLVAIPTNSTSRLTGTPATYNYTFTYEFVDSLNNIHESVTTPVRQIDTATDFTAICARVYACDATLKRGSVRVTMYRSTPSGDGPLIKKVKTATLDASQRHFTFLDFGEDLEEFDRAPVVYTTGGVLDNNQPGSVTDIIEHRGRVFLATPTEFVRFSKPLRQAFAPGFPVPGFVIDVPGDSSQVTAIESNVNFLCIFTENAVMAVQGDGPNAIGAGAFSQPNVIGQGQGAKPGSPHLSHSLGTFYVSDRGVYLIQPNAQISYVGAPLEDLFDSLTVKSIVLFDHLNEIRFLCDDPGGKLGTSDSHVFIFNTYFKLWYRWQVLSADDPVDQINYSSTAGVGSADDTHYILTSSAIIHQQSNTLYQDNSVSYDVKVNLRPIAVNGLQGVQRIYRAMVLYDYKSDSNTAVSVAYDYGAASATYSINPAPSSEPNNMRFHLAKQKCRAIEIAIVFSASGEGMTLNGVALEAGAKPGTFKLPTTKTMSKV